MQYDFVVLYACCTIAINNNNESEQSMGKIILTGDRPTGKLHLGHYVGSLKRRVELQNSGEYDEIYIMIADAQALTDNMENPEKVRQNIIEVALDYCHADLSLKNRLCLYNPKYLNFAKCLSII